ncbi:MAG: anti-sigma factor [Terriglobales bacterium]|jgi:anti-sigma-K factor RskA
MSAHEQFAEDLALYALGSLEGDERQALETHLDGCAACRRELELLRGDVSLLALTAAGPKPPVRARQRLMSAIAAEPRLPVVVATPPDRSQRSWWPTLAWVAVAALVLACIGLLRQNSALQQNLASLQARFSEQGSKLDQANDVVATLLDPEATKIELVAAGSKPQPRGKAIYQRRNRNLIFIASNLPPLPAEKIYELWLFPANGGAPIAAGLFKPDQRGSATLVNPPLPEGVTAKNFVVTLEPESGSHEAPRGTPVIVGLGEGVGE